MRQSTRTSARERGLTCRRAAHTRGSSSSEPNVREPASAACTNGSERRVCSPPPRTAAGTWDGSTSDGTQTRARAGAEAWAALGPRSGTLLSRAAPVQAAIARRGSRPLSTLAWRERGSPTKQYERIGGGGNVPASAARRKARCICARARSMYASPLAPQHSCQLAAQRVAAPPKMKSKHGGLLSVAEGEN